MAYARDQICAMCWHPFYRRHRQTYCGSKCYLAHKRAKAAADLIRRLGSKVPFRPITGCWLYQGTKNAGGYGVISTHKGTQLAHRLLFEAWIKPIPDGLHVCHYCDNPACVRPDHMFLGTPADNNRDRHQKGRSGAAVGTANGRARLNEITVPAIRRLFSEGTAPKRIAEIYGISISQVWNVVKRRSWKHVP